MKQLCFLISMVFSIVVFCMDNSGGSIVLQNNFELQRVKSSPVLDRVKKQFSREVGLGENSIDGKVIPRKQVPQKKEEK